MVDFNKMLREKLGEEKYDKLQRDRAYLAEEKKNYASMSDDELIENVLHAWHNCGCTFPGGRGVNGFRAYDCVYDAALVFRQMPEILLRLMRTSTRFRDDVRKLENGKEVKCPMTSCTSYVELQ